MGVLAVLLARRSAVKWRMSSAVKQGFRPTFDEAVNSPEETPAFVAECTQAPPRAQPLHERRSAP